MRLTFFVVCVLSACAAGSAEGPGAHSGTAAAGGSTSTASGCAPAATGQPGDCAFREEPPPTTRTICKEEKVTGTNITRTVCRSEDDAQTEREAAKDWIRRTGADPTNNGQPVNPGHDPFQRIPR